MKSKSTDTTNIATSIALLVLVIVLLHIININKPNLEALLYKTKAKVSLNAAVNSYTHKDLPKMTTKDIDIGGKYGIVYNASSNKVIWGKGEEVIYPLASITKVMTAYTAMHDCSYQTIKINKKYIEDSPDIGLKIGDVWDKEEAIKYMLLSSSNDIADTLAYNCGGYASFIYKMNNNANVMGTNLKFINASGIDEVGSSGGMGSALDIAKMLVIASEKYPAVFEATTHSIGNFKSETQSISKIPNTNIDISGIRGAMMSKTGLTDMAGGNLSIVYYKDLNQKIVIIVLGSSKDGRFEDVQNLYNYINSL